MDAPPIKYVTTRDGYSIAYTEKGDGPPLVWLPFIWNNQQSAWTDSPRAPLLHRLASDYRVITYDSRGQGCSTRGLRSNHRSADYELDLEALADALKLESFALYAWAFFGNVALGYAGRHPNRIAAMVLRDVRFDLSDMTGFLSLGESNWEMYVETMARLYYDRFPSTIRTSWIKESYSHADWLAMTRSVVLAEPLRVPENLQVPTLVLADKADVRQLLRDGTRLAAAIPGARLVATEGHRLNEGLNEANGRDSSLLKTLLAFLGEVMPPVTRTVESSARTLLTPRERQVLHLIARGRTSREIAGDLVLSERTVGRHITNLYAKIGSRSRAEATVYAIRHNLN